MITGSYSSSAWLKRVVALALGLITLSAGSTTAEPSEGKYFPYPAEGVILGQGWDSLHQRPATDVCIDFQEREIASHETRSSFHEVVNRYQLDRLLKISAAASFKGGIVSGSMEGQFSRESSVNQNHKSVLATVSVLAGSRYAGPVFDQGTYKPIQISASIVQKPEDFFRRCGDSFVAYIEKGGELNSLFTFSESQRKAAESFALNLKAKGFGATASLNTEGRTTTNTEEKFVDINVVQLGGPRIPTPVNAEDYSATVRAFTSLESGFTPKAFRIQVVPYNRLHNYTEIRTNPDFQSLFLLESLLRELRDSYAEILLDYKQGGGVVDPRGVFVTDEKQKYQVLTPIEHSSVSKAALMGWRSSKRLLGAFQRDYNGPYLSVYNELRRFSETDSIICNGYDIRKLENVGDAEVTKFLLFKEADEILNLPNNVDRLEQGQALRSAVASDQNISAFADMITMVLDRTETDGSDAAKFRAINGCLSYIEDHPWGAVAVEKAYLDLEAKLTLVESIINKCYNVLEASGDSDPRSFCDDESALKNFLTSVLPTVLSEIINREALDAAKNWAEFDPERSLLNDLSSELQPAIDTSKVSKHRLKEMLGEKFSAFSTSSGVNPILQPTNEVALKSLANNLLQEKVDELCNDQGLIPCLTVRGAPENSITALNTLDPEAEQGELSISFATAAVTSAATAPKMNITANFGDNALNSGRKELINKLFDAYFKHLLALPIAQSERRDPQGDHKVALDNYEGYEEDLNKYLYRIRVQNSIDFICEMYHDVDVCSQRLSVLDRYKVGLPPLMSNDRRVHVGCVEWATREIRTKRRWLKRLFGHDYDVTYETYCAREGQIVDAYEFVRLADGFLE